MPILTNLIISGALFGAAFWAYGYEMFWAQLVAAILHSFVLMNMAVRILRQYSSLTFLFCFFFILYGLSAPISVALGLGISEIFGENLPFEKALFFYSMGTTGITLGLFIALLQFGPAGSPNYF